MGMKNFIKFLFLVIMSYFTINNIANAKNLVIEDTFFEDINGKTLKLSDLPGKVILIVNTASYCGFTQQYKGLQALTEKFSSKELSIIAVPSNDFGRQEPGNNNEIKDFCEGIYGVTFPIMSKQKVIGKEKHAFYQWIENSFGSKKLPRWNFHKYLINRNGELLHSISSRVSPSSNKFLEKIHSSIK
ncbi:MAG: Hydroperoxy fatty acid reductase gpx1 [Alphaproteobacteria bacterium MarineAlpha9_Bin3]|nr:MAG: Hydroperoxy fatty acid reductase gpx1 [Alphaproteobacteria bacterium MarineAlpha9_Bin3]|tara:strand:- start:1667 stop:2227 length:561 start_codon:yes stop_codon:yes gene_type:complete